MEVKVILSLDEDFKIIANRLLGLLESKLPDKTLYESVSTVELVTPLEGMPKMETPLEDEPKMEEYAPKHAMEPTKKEIVEEDVACVNLSSLRESVKENVVKLVQAKKKDKVVALCEKFGVKKTTDVPDGKLYEFLEELKSL